MTLFLFLLASTLPARAGQWHMQEENSSFFFEARVEQQAMQGKFKSFDVNLVFDANKPSAATLDVDVKLAHADMDDDEINAAIAEHDWFAVAEFPLANFNSTSIRRKDDGGFTASGTLILKGLEQKQVVPFTWVQDGNQARMTGEFFVFRTDFKVGTGEWATNEPIGTDIRLWFDLVLTQSE